MLSTAVVGLKCCCFLRIGKILIFSFTCKKLSQGNFCCWKVSAVSLLFSPVNFSIFNMQTFFLCYMRNRKKTDHILMQSLLILVQSRFWKAQVYYIMEGFLPIIYAFALNITLLSYVISGAEIGFSYQRREWHNGCLCTVPVESINTGAEQTSVFSHFLIFCQLCLSWVIQ